MVEDILHSYQSRKSRQRGGDYERDKTASGE